MQQILPKWFAAAFCLSALLTMGAGVGAAPPAQATSSMAAIHHVANRVTASNDHAQRPFAVVDKRRATIAVYRGDGTLVATAPVLLGQAAGDRSVPGVGERTQSGTLRPDDLTTPAGRFGSEPGHNRNGEAIVWIDYDAAFAIHRLRRDRSHADRARRLASASLDDNRISSGCIVVPESFYDRVIDPVLGRVRGVVYVMPEAGPDDALDAAIGGQKMQPG